MQQRLRRHRHGALDRLRSHYSRRDDARYDGTRDAASHQGGAAHHARHHGDQERGGEYHGQGHRVEDRRLHHQARQSQPSPAVDQEERAFAAARHRADHGRLPRRVRAHSLHVPDGLVVLGVEHALPQDNGVGDRFGRLGRSEHQGGAGVPEERGESGVQQVRAPQLLQLDQQARFGG